MTLTRRMALSGIGALLAAPTWAGTGPAIDIVADGLAFPEGLLALHDGTLLFVEIAAGTLRRLKPGAAQSEIVAYLAGGPNGTTIGADGAAYVANNGGLTFGRINGLLTPTGIPADYRGGSIQRVDLATGRVRTLYEAVDGVPLKAPDDIVCDRWGDLWFTDIGKSHPRYRDHGGLYWCKADGSAIRAAAFPVQNPNGLAFAPDGQTLYVALSDRREIAAFTVADRGRLADGPPKIIAALDGVRLFDNIAVTADGLITIACVLTGQLVTIDRQGRTIDVVAVPDPAPTALAFAGTDRRDLYVTLSGTGRIARLRWPRAGLPPQFRS